MLLSRLAAEYNGYAFDQKLASVQPVHRNRKHRFLHELCRNNSYVDGKWVERSIEKSSEASYPCCAGHAIPRDYDTAHCTHSPENEYPLYGFDFNLPDMFPRSMGHGCACKFHAIKNGL